jgi:hypothetical protein
MTQCNQVAYSKTKNFNKEYCSSGEVAEMPALTESATCFFVFFTESNRKINSDENAENECLLDRRIVLTTYTRILLVLFIEGTTERREDKLVSTWPLFRYAGTS